MKYLVNSREMKRYDTNTISRFHMPGLLLMERAALAFAEEAKKESGCLARVLVVCGTGNNGGDGLAIARLLLLEGIKTDIVLVGNPGKATEENLRQQEILNAYGFAILQEIPKDTHYTMVIDAVFGVGLSRNIEGSYAALIESMNRLSARKLAVDIASGVSADTGAVYGTAFRADKTVTFAYAKVGMLLWPGNEYSGQVIVRDIGITAESRLGETPAVAALEDEDFSMLPVRKSHSNKGSFGRLLIIAGGINMAGAAILSAKAAYAAGCGLVRVLTPEENRIILQCSVPEAILTTYTGNTPGDSVVCEALRWANGTVLGPGLGTTDGARLLVKNVCAMHRADPSVPLVLDADALNVLAANEEWMKGLGENVIFTPHLGEMSRLSGISIAGLQADLPGAAAAFAEKNGVVCVLKDERSVTAVPGGQTYLNCSGNHGMATAGSGDVLSGVIGSLLVQGLPAALAAPLSVYLHGRAGDFAAQEIGACGLTASAIVEGIRRLTKYASGKEANQK